MADFVVRNGSSFEQLMLTKQKDNPKMSFLFPSGVNHPYYRWKVYELTIGTNVHKLSADFCRKTQRSRTCSFSSSCKWNTWAAKTSFSALGSLCNNKYFMFLIAFTGFTFRTRYFRVEIFGINLGSN